MSLERALVINALSYSSVANILRSGLDQAPAMTEAVKPAPPHGNTHGLEADARYLESSTRNHHLNIERTTCGAVMTTLGRKEPSRASINTLSAINRYRHQRRLGRAWLVGDKRIAASTIAGLEREAYVREIAFKGSPYLVLTDEGKRVIAGGER